MLKSNLNIDFPLDVNQRHFLSGRRSWAVGYLPASKICYVETAALERYSHPRYDELDNVLSINAPAIARIWNKMLQDFADYYGLELISNDAIKQIFSDYHKGFWFFGENTGLVPLKPGKFHSLENVYYAQGERPTSTDAYEVPWFKEVIKRHPGLLS